MEKYKGNKKQNYINQYKNFLDKISNKNIQLVGDYISHKITTSFSYKDCVFNTNPSHISRIISYIEEFEKLLSINGDMFISMNQEDYGIVFKIKTYDNEIIERRLTDYKRFIKSRQEYYIMLAKYNIKYKNGYIDATNENTFYIGNAQITTNYDVLKRKIKSLDSFIKTIKEEGDEFLSIEDYSIKGFSLKIKLKYGETMTLNYSSYLLRLKAKYEFEDFLYNNSILMLSDYISKNTLSTFKLEECIFKTTPATLIGSIESLKVFKETIAMEGDIVFSIVNFSNTGFVLKIITYDGGIIEMNNGGYNKFILSRRDFFKKLKANNHIALSPYISNESKVKINLGCTHNVLTAPNKYKNGQHTFCSECIRSDSFGELIIKQYLSEIGLEYEKDHNIISEKNNPMNLKKYDIFIPKYKLVVEVHGLQHYEEVDFFSGRTLKEEQENDIKKKQYALLNGYNYLEIDYREHNPELTLNRFKKQFNTFLNELKKKAN